MPVTRDRDTGRRGDQGESFGGSAWIQEQEQQASEPGRGPCEAALFTVCPSLSVSSFGVPPRHSGTQRQCPASLGDTPRQGFPHLALRLRQRPCSHPRPLGPGLFWHLQAPLGNLCWAVCLHAAFPAVGVGARSGASPECRERRLDWQRLALPSYCLCLSESSSLHQLPSHFTPSSPFRWDQRERLPPVQPLPPSSEATCGEQGREPVRGQQAWGPEPHEGELAHTHAAGHRVGAWLLSRGKVLGVSPKGKAAWVWQQWSACGMWFLGCSSCRRGKQAPWASVLQPWCC